MNAFRILLADAHPIFRHGLRCLLSSHLGWEVCGEAVDGRDAVEKSKQLKPDLLLMDISLPNLNGLDAAGQILHNNPLQRIMLITAVKSDDLVRDSLDLGIRGWVDKADSPEELLAGVAAMQRHSCFFTSQVSNLIVENYLQRHRSDPEAIKKSRLTPREREVVQLVAESKSTKEIATILQISGKTAETHRSNILLKLKLHSTAELVLYAVRNEIIHVQLPPMVELAKTGFQASAGAD